MSYDQKKGPNHKPLESRGQMSFDLGLLYIVGEIFLRAIRYYPFIIKKKLFEKNMGVQSSRTTKVLVLGLLVGSLGER
jgi:hypothetical protein